jgi:hypothetical protein
MERHDVAGRAARATVELSIRYGSEKKTWLSALAIAYAGAGTTRGLTAADLPRIEPFMAEVEG